jgi:RNA polymerase sigma-70 factor, ECF subfamily
VVRHVGHMEKTAGVAGGNIRYLSDEDVAEEAARDLACFDELYHRYADRIFRYALARTGSRSVADDVVGDVMVAAIERIDRFDRRRGGFSAWIFTIAHRKVVDHYRSRQRWRTWLSRQPDPAPLDDNALGSTLLGEQRQSVQAALAALPDQQRDIVVLRFIAELSIRDTSAVLNISEGAVKMRLNRALKNLALELKEPLNER